MNKTKSKITGHILIFITILIWSVAFVSNKALLTYISPMDNMILRFSLAYILLVLIYPQSFLPHSVKDEMYFASLGFLGIFIYFLLENFALKYTQATNAGLYMGAIPIFTAFFAHIMTRDEKLSRNLFYGFGIAMSGMAMILLEGTKFELRLKGDLLALCAAVVFALYSVILKKAPKHYHYIVITRKSFFYAIIMMFIYKLASGSFVNIKALSIPLVHFNILFLGILSSGLAFIFWQQGIEKIGSIKASNYIYLVPLFTAITGIIALKEQCTPTMIAGGMLILLGLYTSQRD